MDRAGLSLFYRSIGENGPIPNCFDMGLTELVRAFSCNPNQKTRAPIGEFQENIFASIVPRILPKDRQFPISHFSIAQTGLASRDSLWLYELVSNRGFSKHESLWESSDGASVMWKAIPEQAKRLILGGQMYLCVTNLFEETSIKNMIRISRMISGSGVPAAHTVFCTSGLVREAAKLQFLNETGANLWTIPYFEAQTIYDHEIGARLARGEIQLQKFVPSKKFIFLNRRIDAVPHRLAIFLDIVRRNLVCLRHISMVWRDLASPNLTFRDRIDEISQIGPSRYLSELLAYGRSHFRHQEKSDLLPLTLDVEFSPNTQRKFEMVDHLSETIASYFRDSFFSIVPECTYVPGGINDETAPSMISEKTFFAMLNLHPFLIVGEPYSLERLREYGYQTFSNWWDESYDRLEDTALRLERLANLVEHLSTISTAEWKKMTMEMLPVLKHNRDRMLARVFESADWTVEAAQRQINSSL